MSRENIDFADIFFLDIFSDKVYDNIENTNIFVLRGFMMRLKQIRKERGIKQTTLCAALGIAQSTLSSWENSIYEPDQNTTLKLADYFGVTVDYLLGRDEPSPTPTPAPTDNTITEERLRALGIDTDKLENLSDEQLSVIRTTLSALLDSFKKSNK